MNKIIQELKNYQILQKNTIPYRKKGNYKIFNITNKQLFSINYIKDYSDYYYYFRYINNFSCKDLNELVIKQAFNLI